MFNQIWNAERGNGNAHQNPLRDTEHGRIYIVEYNGKSGDDISSLSTSDTDGLLEGLKSTNQFWRLTAQRLIVENNLIEVAPQLVEMIEDQSVDQLGLNTPAVHALWTLHGLGMAEEMKQTIVDALSHSSAAVRKAAIEVLPTTADIAESLAYKGMFSDKNLNTRLSAILRVADLGDEASDELKAAARAGKEGGDEWINAALAILEPKEEMATQTAEQASLSGLPKAVITINASPSEMVYQQTEISAYEGQAIELLFNNLHPDLHNVVILKAGSDMSSFGEALNAYATNPDAADNAYIPPGSQDLVVASTRVLGLEESERIQISGLPPGEYPFVCTVPGHWPLMQGVLTIEPLN